MPKSHNSEKISNDLTAIIPIADIADRTDKLENILSQSSKGNVNIILVHDIQDLNNCPIIKSIFNNYSRDSDIYIEGFYGTAGQARNAGFQLCKTEWVCFWDSDDQVFVDKFIDMVDDADKLKYEIAMGLISVKSEKKSTLPCLSDKLVQNIFFDLQIANFPAFTRMAFRTPLIKANPFPDIKIGEDLIFLLSLNLPVKRIYLSNSEVYRYFIGSKYQTTFNYDIDVMYELLLRILNLIENKQFVSKRMAIAMLNKILLRIVKQEHKMTLKKFGILSRVILIDLKNIHQFILVMVYLVLNRPKIIKALHES